MTKATLTVAACATLLCATLVLTSAERAHALTIPGTTLGAMTRSAARVFRGQCVRVEASTAEVAGVRLPVTTYTFHVGEHLKGSGGDTVTFRQVGTPGGGPRDLGHLVGLPVYSSGTDYVLFLLPESPAGLTSPAGAAEGAFVVSGGAVRSVRGGAPPALGLPRRAAAAAAPHGVPTVSYEDFRRAVIEEATQ